MKIFWICAFLLVSVALGDHALALDYDDYYGSLEDLDKLIKDYDKNNEKTDLENDLKVEEEIQEFRKGEEVKDTVDSIEDYQFEDNRDNKDTKDANDNLEVNDSDKDNVAENDNVDEVALEYNRPEHDQNDNYAILWGDDNIAPLPNDNADYNLQDDVVDEDIVKLTQEILDARDNGNFDGNEEKSIDSDFNEGKDENLDIKEETKQILEEEGADKFDSNDEALKSIDSGFYEGDDENLDIKEETKQILKEEGADKFDSNDEAPKSNDSGFDNEGNDENLEIKEETQRILQEEGAEKFDENDEAPKSVEINQEVVKETADTEEDTIDKAYEDFDADIDKLFETLDKLKESEKDDNLDEVIENEDQLVDEPAADNLNDETADENVKDVPANDNINEDDVQEEIEKLNKVIEETDASDVALEDEQDVLANQDDVQEIGEEDTINKAYDDLNADLDKLFDTLDKLKGANNDDEKLEKMESEIDDSLDWDDFENVDGSDEVPVDFDKLLENINNEDDAKEEILDLGNDEINEPNPDDAPEDVESFGDKIIFGDDAILDQDNKEPTEENDENRTEQKDFKTATVDELDSSQLDDLVSQFSILHSEDLDVHSDNFVEKNSAPIHITLKVDEPTIITSPDYPSPYPTNNIVDWIISGDGEGIELNITEFAVNGALGDYLLIKPGGVDESGHDGLLFTYRLNEERRYRFTDVDRVFMRFEAKLGMMFFRGFSISAKMIAPLPTITEDIPEPEPVVSAPHSTATVHLTSSVLQFQEVREQFQALLANMAAEYIRDNDIDPGVNATSEVTQITSVHLCPISWPNFEQCVAVTFGVPLEYEEEENPRLNEEDLKNMWLQYSGEEPFASAMEKLGLSEFDQPSGAAMTAWLVIAGGVIIAMVMLAAVLWRYSCFEDYTRMKAYSDTDSIHNEKRTLDLYPTPHQTLPPLYAESEYKWPEDDSTRVDMGGFANRSYATDNMYDFESDEDVIVPRDRNVSGNPKDVSKV